ncbi:MAG: PQQ-binding-like beta-propeller repeat protein [Bacteroidales bacterium]
MKRILLRPRGPEGLIRRVVSFGLAALLAGVLPQTVSAQDKTCWGNFRGNAQLQGVSPAALPQSPKLLWNFNAADAIKAAPVACGSTIVVGTSRGSIVAINADGTLKWKMVTENSIEAPALIRNGIVYLGNLEGVLYAIDLESGQVKWTYETENQIMGSPTYYEKDGKAVLLVGSYDYYLHGIDARTGKGLWKYETNNFINGACALYAGHAVFGGCDGYLHMVDAITGKARNPMEISTYVASSAAIDGDVAFVGDYDGYFSAVHLMDQKVVWSFNNPAANLPFIGSPSVRGNRVYIGNRDKYMYCLNKATGELVWKYNTGSRVDASPVLVGKQVLAANMRGDLQLLNAVSGKVEWSYELGTPVNANPAVVEGRIYVAGDDGRIYCFGK